jgi:hypothetical protein
MSNIKVMDFFRLGAKPTTDNLYVHALSYEKEPTGSGQYVQGIAVHESVTLDSPTTNGEVISAVGSSITFSAATKMLKDYIDKYVDTDRTLSVLFGKQQIFQVLMQEGCEALRFYFGRKPDEDGAIRDTILIVGVDMKGNDLKTSSTLGTPGAARPDDFPVVKEVGNGKTIAEHIKMQKARFDQGEETSSYGLLNDLKVL